MCNVTYYTVGDLGHVTYCVVCVVYVFSCIYTYMCILYVFSRILCTCNLYVFVMCFSMVATTVFFDRGPPTWCINLSTYGMSHGFLVGRHVGHLHVCLPSLPTCIFRQSTISEITSSTPDAQQAVNKMSNTTCDALI
jgi:hypothetical protein